MVTFHIYVLEGEVNVEAGWSSQGAHTNTQNEEKEEEEPSTFVDQKVLRMMVNIFI